MKTMTNNRISEAFRTRTHPLLIPYVTVGDPTPEATMDILFTLEEAGADVIELGVPYSDPLADGPVIQAASERALRNGVTLSAVLEMAAVARQRGLTVPLVLFSYVNPILQLGFQPLCQRAAAAEIDGLIVPDLPLEENSALLQVAKAHGMALIPLVAPTSEKRIQSIVTQAEGFIYCVSSLGTTGARDTFGEDIPSFLDRVRQYSPVPTAVGFGISKREHVVKFSPHVDAVVVGSALVRVIASVQDSLTDPTRKKTAHAQIGQFVRMLKNE